MPRLADMPTPRFRRTPPGPDRLADTVRRRGVRDERVIAGVRSVPRAAFVPVDHAGMAYRDVPVPIGHHQVTTQPSLSALMLEALGLTGPETVLEIGTGYGFQTALLARLAAVVWSVERWAELAETARHNLERQGVRNAHVVVADGSGGLPEHAPFDAILVSAAFPTVPEPLADQLVPGGRLVQPIGQGGDEDVMLFRREPTGLQRMATLTRAHFVRLYGAHGFRRET